MSQTVFCSCEQSAEAEAFFREGRSKTFAMMPVGAEQSTDTRSVERYGNPQSTSTTFSRLSPKPPAPQRTVVEMLMTGESESLVVLGGGCQLLDMRKLCNSTFANTLAESTQLASMGAGTGYAAVGITGRDTVMLQERATEHHSTERVGNAIAVEVEDCTQREPTPSGAGPKPGPTLVAGPNLQPHGKPFDM